MEMIIILVLAFGAMWLMTNRTRKQQRKAGDFRANLEVGQEVMTGSGLYGMIVALDGDTITLESTPGNQSRWIRAAISKVVEPPVVDEADDDEVDYASDEYDADDAADDYADDDYDDDDADADDDDDENSAIEVPDDLSSLPELNEPDLHRDDDTDKK